MQDLGLVGSEGEYYYHPSKKATLKIPTSIEPPVVKSVDKANPPSVYTSGSRSKMKKAQTVPIFPYNRYEYDVN